MVEQDQSNGDPERTEDKPGSLPEQPMTSELRLAYALAYSQVHQDHLFANNGSEKPEEPAEQQPSFRMYAVVSDSTA